MRPDGFVLGQDPEEKQEQEVITAAGGGCKRCGRTWPAVTFKQMAGQSFLGEEKPEILCDRCVGGDPEIDKAIEEVTTGTIPGLIRSVEVTGIESKTNVIKFRYPTHIGEKALTVTTLSVWFKSKKQTEADKIEMPGAHPDTFAIRYDYRNVPTSVCEAWFAAPQHGQSFGAYFVSFIRNSYDSEKKQ